jgi:hypothetical protein
LQVDRPTQALLFFCLVGFFLFEFFLFLFLTLMVFK